MIHLIEEKSFNEMCAELKDLVRNFLNQNKTYKKFQKYIKVANENLDSFHSQLCNFTYDFENRKLLKIFINEESFINRGINEITIVYAGECGTDHIRIDISTFMIIMCASGLIKN